MACANCDGVTGAHCIHELWMRGEFAGNIEPALQMLWHGAAESIPDCCPCATSTGCRTAYEVSERFPRGAGVRLISTLAADYSDSRPEPYGSTSV